MSLELFPILLRFYVTDQHKVKHNCGGKRFNSKVLCAIVFSRSDSTLCRTTFCCNYSCSSLLGIQYIDQFCTSSDWKFDSFFFTKQLSKIGWRALEQECLSLATDYQIFSYKLWTLTHGCALLTKYLTPSIFLSAQTSFPVPAEWNNPHSMTLPSTCLTECLLRETLGFMCD